MRPLFVLFLLTLNLGAKSKEDLVHTFNSPFNQVWAACVAAAGENDSVILHSDKESGTITFQTEQRRRHLPYRVGVSVVKLTDRETRVTLGLQVIIQGFGASSGKAKTEAEFWKSLEDHLHPVASPSK